MTTEFSELPFRPLCGQGPVVGTAPLVRLADFWQWSMSGLMENTTRGPLAEFLVAAALGVQDKPQKNWENYDLLMPRNGRCVKIEVKSSAERQSWRCKPVASHSFDIKKTEDSNQYESGKRRWSHVYVFCILRNRHATDQPGTALRQKACAPRFRLSKWTNSSGVSNSVTNVAKVSPPMIERAIGM